MRTFSGKLGGRPWTGQMPERPDELHTFREWVQRQAETGVPVAVDTETKGLRIYGGEAGFLRLVQFGTEEEAWAIPVELAGPFAASSRWALETLPDITGHNWATFDALVLDRYQGVSLESLCAKAVDTMILAKLIDPRKPEEGGIGAQLKGLSAHYIDPEAPDTQDGLKAVFREEKLTIGEGFSRIDLWHPVYCEYALLDVILTSRLRTRLVAELRRLGVRQTLSQYEHHVARICAQMMRTGMVLDTEYTETLRDTLTAEQEKHARIAARYGVEKLGSPKQIADALLGMGEEIKDRTPTGAVKVDKAVLLRIADLNRDWERVGARTPNPLADAVLRAKRAGKWRSAYADNFLDIVGEDGRIHPNIQTLQARTGRMSVTNPAVQTLPSSDYMIRRALLADEGHVMVSCDFAAVEMRVLAALAGVQKMREGFMSGGADFDIHMHTARLIAGEGATKKDRKVFKGAGFGQVYGGGVATIARQTGASEADVRRAVDAYDRLYPEIKTASRRWQREAYANGMVAVTLTGRRLPLDRDRTYAVVNYHCQSVARDCLGQALLHMDEEGLVPYLRLPVHDEVVASVPRDHAAEVAREIERCMTFDLCGVPLVAEAEIGGRSWGSLYGADM